jgi:hypothetical protein
MTILKLEVDIMRIHDDGKSGQLYEKKKLLDYTALITITCVIVLT